MLPQCSAPFPSAGLPALLPVDGGDQGAWRDILVDTVPWVLEPLKDGQQGLHAFHGLLHLLRVCWDVWHSHIVEEPLAHCLSTCVATTCPSKMPNSSPIGLQAGSYTSRSSTGELAASWLLSSSNWIWSSADKVKNLMGRLTSSQHFIYLLRAELQVEVLFLPLMCVCRLSAEQCHHMQRHGLLGWLAPGERESPFWFNPIWGIPWI